MISFPVAQTHQSAVPTPDEIAQTLARDPQALRFKKLLIYCGTGVWESHPDRLEALQFSELLNTLQSLRLTWQELQSLLAKAVYYLNKAAEYTLVAHALLELLKPLYPEAAQTGAIDPQVYEPIAQQLAADLDLLRLKKLLILACTNQWESDRSKVEQMPLLPLIQKLHGLTPNRSSLCCLLDHLVNTLSKATEYRLIADRLIQAFQPLYLEPEPVALQTPPGEIAAHEQLPVSATAPESSETDSIAHPRPSATSKFSTIAEATAALSALLHEQNKRSSPGLTPTVASISTGSPDRDRLSSRFNLRQGVVQASNPLRTKILLFSLLHEPFQLQQHEAILRDHDLDDLLQTACHTYRQVAQLKAALHQVACKLPNSQAYSQSITAVLQAIQRFAPDPSTLSAQSTTADPTYQSEVSQLTQHLHYPIALTPSPTASLFREATEVIVPETHSAPRETAEQSTHG